MAQKKQKKVALAICIATFIGIIAGCVNDKDLYNPEFNKTTLPTTTKEFGFATKGNVRLSVNYGVPGFKTLIEVYDENPMDGSNKLKKNLKPIYSAYTDENGKFEGIMNIPTAIKEAYLYTSLIGLPQSVKLETTSNGFVYNATQTLQAKKLATRAVSCPYVNTGSFPYKAHGFNGYERYDNMYSIVTWDANGVPSGDLISQTTKIGDELIGTVSKRVTDFLIASDGSNKKYLREPDQINIKTTTDGTKVNITFMEGKGQFRNSFGYYYYKTNTPMKSDDFYGMKKYLVFPGAFSNYGTQPGTTVKILYFDENGVGHEEFPAGYTIGWFLISDGFDYNTNSYVKQLDELAYNSGSSINSLKYRNACISNDVGDYRQFITIYDEKSKLRIVGIEDSLFPKYSGDDYRDLTFFVSVTPDAGAGDLEPVPDPEKPESATISQSGTLAFEDNWPNKGDYDMNDVVVEYNRVAAFDGNNNATTITETFKFVQRSDAAVFNNYFAYKVENMGTVTSAESCSIEQETGSIIINGTSKANMGKTFTVTREFTGNFAKDDVLKDFDPYIIVSELSDSRKEVHLPNKVPTSKADHSLLFTGSEAWYMDINGKYPFAIDIPITDFKLSPEITPIDQTYSKFASWVASGGKEDQDWYKQ